MKGKYAMPDDELLKWLRAERQAYVEARKQAAQIAAAVPNTDVGRAAAERCKILDGAILSVDEALKIELD